MSTPTVPPAFNTQELQPSRRALTIASFLMSLAYLVWFWLMFALGYWVADLVGAYPSTDIPMTDLGLLGWVVAIAYALVVGLPSWIGVGLAVAARRRGAGAAALTALALNLVIAAGFATLALLP